ncbi:SMC family ATPase [Oceanispirochaeta crateris]|uniref:SMC family ATPase n=1 Tax=Oceanispirochaeta crateris TaxID=2518645 RepID=A0A5C1QQ78_9SPIO|nr:SMC family ATPase [Oceanispirochaeta crateris]QEN09130.1 SMC family ATPase [Oceanispirochaeta crateris]
MIPLKLTLEGVYSYRTRQIIDFQTLSEAGLFGVFGSVGSGKSAILESMTYALYGQIERLNEKEQRGYNIMNLQSSSLYIDFEFNHNNEVYRFTVTAKRHKKDFNKVQSPERSGYIKKDSQWVPLPDEGIRGGISAEAVMGLSYEHFRKTVIIPQGKFQEFIMLPPSGRTGMIETLFGLERFNLSSKTSVLLARCREECSFLEGKLDDLQGLSPENLETMDQELDLLNEVIIQKTSDRKKQADQLKELEEILSLKQELSEIEKDLLEMESRRDEIRRKEEELVQFRRLDRLFSQDLTRQKELTRQNQEILQKKEDLTSEISSAEQSLKKQEAYWQRLLKDQEQYGDLIKTRDSLESAVKYKEMQELKERSVLVLKELEQSMKGLESEHNEMILHLENLDQEIVSIEEKVETGEQIKPLQDWYSRSSFLKERLLNQNENIKETQEQKRSSLSRLKELIPDVRIQPEDTASILKEKLMEVLQKEADELEKKRNSLEERKGRQYHLKLLAEMAESLQEGKPCPLCGATHHPEVISTAQEASIDEAEEVLRVSQNEVQTKKEGILEVLNRLEHLESEEEKQQALLKNMKAEKMTLNNEFIWKDYDRDNKDQLLQLEKDLAASKNRLKDLRKKRRALEQKTRESGSKLHNRENEKTKIHAELKSITLQMRTLESKIIPEHRQELPSGQLEDLNTRLEDLNRDYQSLKSSRRAKEEELQILRNEKYSLEISLQNNRKEKSLLEQSIAEKMQSEESPSLERIEKILSQPPDDEKERKIIETYYNAVQLLGEKKKKITVALQGKNEIQADPLELKNSLNELEFSILQDQRRVGALKTQREDLKIKLDQKRTLALSLEKQKIRLDNLKEMASLFKGRKFVEFIAAVYLNELCQLANIRFSSMSNRSLELVFQDNQILVRDFLNEGRLRHIKTLSGGQTFQAALCLALALAEQTGRGKGSFFFLDEGFGSLDSASLETVMASLRQLSREGRIIGLISHVEDLQQDLDVWLRVSRDDELGSRIQSSWKRKEEA